MRTIKIYSLLVALLVINSMILIADDIKDFFDAIQNGNINAVRSLLTTNPSLAKVAPRTHASQTPLHDASHKNQLEIAKLLISHGAQIDVTDDNGLKPIDFAASQEMKNLLHNSMLPKFLKRNNFFTDIMGVSETDFKNDLHNFQDKISYNPIDKTHTLTINNKSFLMGNFKQLSINDLENEAAHKPMPGGGTFNVFYGNNLDVAAFQASAENTGAVFQVASNFNGLETTHANQDITNQLITHYISDPTQGPSASISAAPGLIFRRYFLFYDKDTSIDEWGQDKQGNRQVNFLNEITQHGENNLPTMSRAGYVQFSNTMRKPSDADYKKIKIGYHSHTAVTFGARSGSNHATVPLPYPVIDQVFAAAADFGSTNGFLKENAVAQEWAQLLLNAAYQGALYAAFINNRKKIFLTLMGGGVFANDFSWICQAITRLENFIKASGLEVILIWRDQYQDEKIVNALKPLVEQTGGHWTDCSEAKNNPLSDVVIVSEKKDSLTNNLFILNKKLSTLKSVLMELNNKLEQLKNFCKVHPTKK